MIQLIDVSVHAGKFSLEHLTMEIPDGAYVVLMGASGSGKTTLLEAICGLKTIRSGQLILNGRDVTHLSPAERGIGYVPQDLALFPTMTVLQHLEFALSLRWWPRQQKRERVAELARLLRLESLLSRRVTDLSGGESQRVALGRALSFHPQIVLLDEPLSALDEQTRSEMQAVLRETQQASGITFLHVTHLRSEADEMADRLVTLQHGQLRVHSPSATASAKSG